MKDKLTALKNLAVANNFHDEKDIVFMVDKINETTSIQKSQYGNVPSQPSDIARKVEDKTTLQGKLKLLGTQIPDLLDKIAKMGNTNEHIIKIDKQLGDQIYFMKKLHPDKYAYDLILPEIHKPDVKKAIQTLSERVDNISSKLFSRVRNKSFEHSLYLSFVNKYNFQ